MLEEDIEVRHFANICFLENESACHGVLDDLVICSNVIGLRKNTARFLSIDELATLRGIEPFAGTNEGLGNRDHGFGILIRPLAGHPKNLFRIVLPDIVIGGHGNANSLGDRLLIPWFTDTVAGDRSCFEGSRHLRRRGHGEFNGSIRAPGKIGLGIKARMNFGSRKPIAYFIIMGRNRENHAHLELFTLGEEIIDNGFKAVGTDRVLRGIGVQIKVVLLHLGPDGIGNRNAVPIEIQSERGDNVSLCADSDCGGDRLPGEHVSPVKVASDYIIQKNLPVRLGDDFDLQTLVLKEAFFLGNNNGGTVREFDKSELQFVFLHIEFPGSFFRNTFLLWGFRRDLARCRSRLVYRNLRRRRVFFATRSQ